MVFALLHRIQTITMIIPTSKITKPPDIQKIKCFYIYIFLQNISFAYLIRIQQTLSLVNFRDISWIRFQIFLINIISLYVPKPKVSEGGPIQQTILLLCNRPWHNGTLAFRLTFCKYLDQVLKTWALWEALFEKNALNLMHSAILAENIFCTTQLN